MQCVKDGFRREHAGFHGEVDALETLGVEKRRRIADEQSAVNGRRGNGEVPPLGKSLCSIAKHLPAFQQTAHPGMSLELLEGVVRIKAWILIIEAGNQAHGKERV